MSRLILTSSFLTNGACSFEKGNTPKGGGGDTKSYLYTSELPWVNIKKINVAIFF